MKKKIIKKENTLVATDNKRFNKLYLRAQSYIDTARQTVKKTIDTEMVKAYWQIGRDIVEEEQYGKKRAEYGESVLKMLAIKLQAKYKRGFGVDTLEQARKFYLTYDLMDKKISDTLCRKSRIPILNQKLSWSHYRELMRVKRIEARQFYEVEATKNNWSVRELKRQIGSLLFDRLAKSKDKEGLLALANKGHEIASPEDAIKEPIILEFLGLPESHRLVESKLEEALIANLQKFLLELGRGFAFVARQRRLTLDNQHFYADLVFYHTVLKCYVIIDIKTRALTHNDLGQMQLYVNYFDQEVKMENDSPTLGLILCTEKSDVIVKYTLGDKVKQIFASEYRFHLPTEKELEDEIKREIKEIKGQLLISDELIEVHKT